MPSIVVGALLTGAISAGVTAVVSGIAAVTLATFAIPAAITLGVGLISRAFAPKAPSLSASPQSKERGVVARTINETITPARWVVGRVRAEGRLVWAHEDDDDLHLAYVLSEGECEGIEEIWADGEELPLVKSSSGGHNVFTVSGKFECHEYFKADGTEGAESFVAASGAHLPWDASSVQGKGLSWVYVKLTQNDYGDDLDSRQWNRIPALEFIMKGIKISRNRNPAANRAFTDNAAIVRKWWLTERRGVDYRKINNTYYTAARTRCATMIDISNLTGFDSSEMQGDLTRYTINGLIHSGDDVTRIEEDMDFAWDGAVVDWDGELLFRPGGDRGSVMELVGDNIVEEPIYRPGTTLNSNRYVADIPQSEWHDMLPYTLRVDDSGKQTYDGVIQTLNLGTTEFVTNPAQAANLLRSAARRARASSSIEVTLMPGDDFEHSTIIPGDKITMQLPELGIADQDFFVLDSKVLPGWAVRLVLTEWGSDWYDDSVSLEHFTPRRVSQVGILTAPSPVTVLITPKYNDDNTIAWYAFLSMPKTPYSYSIRYRHSSNTTSWQEATTHSSQTVLNLNEAGTWTFEVRRFSLDGRRSPATTVTGEAGFEVILPSAPTLARKEFNGNFARFVFAGLARFVQGIEIAYTFEPLSSNDSPGSIAEADWEASTKLGSYSFLPARSTTEERTIVDTVPSQGKYNFYARSVDIAGRLSPLTHLGSYNYQVAPPSNVKVDEYADGTRAYTFTLPPDPSVNGVIVRYRADAQGATPPASPEGDTDPPEIERIYAASQRVYIVYDELIDDSSVPDTSAFSLWIDSNSVTISRISVLNNIVRVHSTSSFTSDQRIQVIYTAPDTNPIQDEAGNAALSTGIHTAQNEQGIDQTRPAWNLMEPLHDGVLANSPYLSKSPLAGRWAFAFRSHATGGGLSDPVYTRATLGDPFTANIAEAVREAIADNPSLVNLDAEIEKANNAADRASGFATSAEASKIASDAAKTAAETAEMAAEQAETNAETAQAATETARNAAQTAQATAEAEALKAADSATAAAGSATAAAGSVTTATQQANASKTSADSSATQASAAAASATLAGQSATAAASSATTAASKASEAGTEATAAATEATKAQTEAGKAATSASSAATSATNADGSAKAAAATADSVTSSVGDAADSATAAADSAKAASASKDAAATSASSAATEATKAQTEASKAATSATQASSSETNADGSATSAASSSSSAKTQADNAAGSATAAASSASTAASEATKAGQSASAASGSATTAATEASKASSSASDAATSASNADGSATAAASSASGIKAQADRAASEAGDADASATAAAGSASNAAASATAAGQSASTAQTAATSAQTRAGTAGTAATNAASSATEADGSAKAAASSAMAAAASATGLQGIADAASTSAMTATTKASEAETSAQAAATSATNAATSEANASTSETNAAAAVTNAQGAASTATTAQTAAAGFANDARQAVAGISGTVSAQIDSELQTTFASILSIRAVADDAQARLELVALSDPSGSRSAGIFTGDFQSFEYATPGGTIPGIKARADDVLGLTFVSKLFRDNDNGATVTIRKQRVGTGVRRVTCTGGRNIVVTLIDTGTQDTVRFTRADVAAAVNANGSSVMRCRGDGEIAVDFENISAGDPASQIARATLAGGKDSRVVQGGAGWILRRDGSAEFDAASIRGVLSADHIDSDVQNWTPVYISDNTPILNTVGAGGPSVAVYTQAVMDGSTRNNTIPQNTIGYFDIGTDINSLNGILSTWRRNRITNVHPWVYSVAYREPFIQEIDSSIVTPRILEALANFDANASTVIGGVTYIRGGGSYMVSPLVSDGPTAIVWKDPDDVVGRYRYVFGLRTGRRFSNGTHSIRTMWNLKFPTRGG